MIVIITLIETSSILVNLTLIAAIFALIGSMIPAIQGGAPAGIGAGCAAS